MTKEANTTRVIITPTTTMEDTNLVKREPRDTALDQRDITPKDTIRRYS